MDQINNAFELCSGNLSNLPSKYKKWKTLSFYRVQWAFIYDEETRDSIAEQDMGLEFLRSINCWLKPRLTIEYSQKLLTFQGLGAIFEAVLKDLWKNQIDNSNMKKEVRSLQIEKLEKDNFSYLIKVSRAADFLDESWQKYLDEVRNIQNLGHLIKNIKRRKNLEKSIFEKPHDELKKDLDLFKEFIKTKYIEGVEIPF